MCLGLETIKPILDIVGHDGSEIIHLDLPEPQKRRSFNFTEIAIAALALGKSLTHLAHVNVTTTRDRKFFAPVFDLVNLLPYYDGIILGHPPNSINNHAVSWNREEEKIYDPNGTIYSPDGFDIRHFLVVR